MKWLFVFAHPDDETVACAATIKQLVEIGQEVKVISVTSGDAGEVGLQARDRFPDSSVTEIRRVEFKQVCQHLGCQGELFDFRDGQLNNELVWNELRSRLETEFTAYQPQAVVTFDHTGWYYHLDHIGVSISVAWALQSYEADFYWQVAMPSHTDKWPYAYYPLPVTHQVVVNDKPHKKAALKMHLSQQLTFPLQLLEEAKPVEEYILVNATLAGKEWLRSQSIFQKK